MSLYQHIIAKVIPCKLTQSLVLNGKAECQSSGPWCPLGKATHCRRRALKVSIRSEDLRGTHGMEDGVYGLNGGLKK